MVFRNPRTASREKKGVLRQDENGLFETSLGYHSKTKLKVCDCGLVVAEQLRGDFRPGQMADSSACSAEGTRVRSGGQDAEITETRVLGLARN